MKDVQDAYRRIRNITNHQTKFWQNPTGWAPAEATEILVNAKLDWQMSLVDSLSRWLEDDTLSDGDLILAWTNLGSIVEGSLKLFLCVYIADYSKSPEKFVYTKNGQPEIISPESTNLEKLRQFIAHKENIFPEYADFIQLVQDNRNTIHAFKPRKLSPQNIFNGAVKTYSLFLQELEHRLPYP